jgi:hypothetical protein
MSDTPRTDDQERWILSEGGRYSVVGSHFARDLERELAAANERIRRLEAAGNAMHHEMQFGEWRAGTPRAQANAARHSWLAEMGGRV